VSSGLVSVRVPTSPPPLQQSLRLRLRLALRRRVLDREIAAGLPAIEDPARALRAEQLTSRPERRCVAACLTCLLDATNERHADPASRLELNHAEILAARHKVVELVEMLRSDRPVTARGMALATMLTENDGPLLRTRPGRTVLAAVSETIVAL